VYRKVLTGVTSGSPPDERFEQWEILDDMRHMTELVHGIMPDEAPYTSDELITRLQRARLLTFLALVKLLFPEETSQSRKRLFGWVEAAEVHDDFTTMLPDFLIKQLLELPLKDLQSRYPAKKPEVRA
jgi:hypothetical protein